MIADDPANRARSRFRSRSTASGSPASPLAAALPYVLFALLAAASWSRWIEPYVDTGRELMVPWRVAQGERLYAQVHFHHGPLAPWLGAVCDLVFGRSIPARTALAAVFALLNLAALQALARRLLSPWRAALATTLAVAVAVFLRPGGWMFPFSFDCAIAVAALTWSLVLAERGRGGAGTSWDGAAGFCLLAALLSRVEIGLAGIAVLAFASRREPLRLLRLAFFPLAAAAAVYGAVSYGIPRAGLVSDGWLRVLDPPEAFRHVYRAYAGLDRIGLRSAELALTAVVLALLAAFVCGVSAVAARLSARSPGAARSVEAAAVVFLAAVGAVSVRPPASVTQTLSLIPPLVRVIPPVVVGAAALRLALRLLRREPRGPFAAVPDAALFLGAIFAARILLAGGYAGPYGSFFLPLPTILCVAGLLGIADRAAPALGASLPRLAGAALVVFLAARIATVAGYYRQPGWSVVSTPAGSVVLPEPVASTTRAALSDLRARLAPGASLSGFPEGGFFGYALGLRNPLPLEQLFPGHLDAAGEQGAISLLRTRPPDVLVYANVLAVGEGQRVFGADYLRDLDAAARAGFPTAAIYGPGARTGARIGDPDFFVEIRAPAGDRR